jgi:hypothetical protein
LWQRDRKICSSRTADRDQQQTGLSNFDAEIWIILDVMLLVIFSNSSNFPDELDSG